jgi:hypothetical protein
MRAKVVVALLLLLTAVAFGEKSRTIDLAWGVKTGALSAEFRGAGDARVSGVIRRQGTGPVTVRLPRGTQFTTARPGLQSLVSAQDTSIDLTSGDSAQIEVPTLCINFGKPPPTPEDVVSLGPVGDEGVRRILSLPYVSGVSRAALQIAVWELTDNPSAAAVQPFLRRMGGPPGQILTDATGLITDAGFTTSDYKVTPPTVVPKDVPKTWPTTPSTPGTPSIPVIPIPGVVDNGGGGTTPQGGDTDEPSNPPVTDTSTDEAHTPEVAVGALLAAPLIPAALTWLRRRRRHDMESGPDAE